MTAMTSLLLLLSLFVPAASAAFSDVPPAHPNAEAVAHLQSQGVVRGYADGSFGPEKTINRAEFVKILTGLPIETVRVAECDRGTGPLFSDVAWGQWYAPAVCYGKWMGFIGGYPDGTFRPDARINVAEAAKILVGFFRLPTQTTRCGGADGARCFDPDAADEPWYTDFIVTLGERAALPPSIESVDSLLTRGEMAEMVFRLWTGNQEKPSLSANALLGTRFEGEYEAAGYLPFSPGLLGNGESAVLFFHASWCPFCRAHDETLQAWYAGDAPGIPVYRVDYDTAKDLRQRYSVTQQDSFVLIDGDGVGVKTLVSPSDAQLRALVGE